MRTTGGPPASGDASSRSTSLWGSSRACPSSSSSGPTGRDSRAVPAASPGRRSPWKASSPSSSNRPSWASSLYVLEGSIITQVKGASPQTVHAGGVFYESPTDVHSVSRNASETQPAKLLVFYVKAKGAPPTVLLGEGERNCLSRTRKPPRPGWRPTNREFRNEDRRYGRHRPDGPEDRPHPPPPRPRGRRPPPK